ncbi:hypothetical protein H4R18_004431 [Coemansia javaensis]|uniref:ACB domain-containing protein n=1 Tax=Coemansia javaensis TaxID=2761396 RepID=A0A9W8HC88_9FUNG|nr:hypothetical protein H4R18_004431 [Coemansia javaensis]
MSAAPLTEAELEQLKAQFEAKAEEVKVLPKAPSNEVKLQLYGLFKQSKVGNNTTPKPGMLDFKGKAMWEAWTAQKDKEPAKAMDEYIKLVEKLQEEAKAEAAE